MKKAFQKGLQWWKGLPWYWKILGCLVLVLLGVLWVLSLFEGNSKDLSAVDNFQENKTDAALADLEKKKAANAKVIALKKREITTRLNQARKIDASTLERRRAIAEATTMEELDKLQEEMDL